MKIAIFVSTAATLAMLAGPALAVGHSTAKEREITRQLNLEQSRQAQSSNQNSAQQVASANTQEQSAPAAAPTTPVESAPAASPAGNADQSQSQDANPQPASPAQ